MGALGQVRQCTIGIHALQADRLHSIRISDLHDANACRHGHAFQDQRPLRRLNRPKPFRTRHYPLSRRLIVSKASQNMAFQKSHISTQTNRSLQGCNMRNAQNHDHDSSHPYSNAKTDHQKQNRRLPPGGLFYRSLLNNIPMGFCSATTDGISLSAAAAASSSGFLIGRVGGGIVSFLPMASTIKSSQAARR